MDRIHCIIEGFSYDDFSDKFDKYLSEYGISHLGDSKLKLKIGAFTITIPILHIEKTSYTCKVYQNLLASHWRNSGLPVSN